MFSNDAERKAFLEGYQKWGLWMELKDLDLRLYRADLHDGSYIIAVEARNSYAPDTGFRCGCKLEEWTANSVWRSTPFGEYALAQFHMVRPNHGLGEFFDPCHPTGCTRILNHLRKI